MDSIIVFVAKYVFVLSIIVAGVYWLMASKQKKIDILKLAIISFPLSYILTKILEKFIYDPRPFVVDHIKPLIAHAADNGFPSDHTLLTATIAAAVFAYNKKLGLALFVISLAIGIARILAQIHHPLDIIGSVVIGVSATYIGYLCLKIINKKFFPVAEKSK